MSFVGRIYRIDFPDGYFYIGSTKNTLEKRFTEHKYERMTKVNKLKAEGNLPMAAFDIYLYEKGWNNPSIVLLFEINVYDKGELEYVEHILIARYINHPKNLNAVCNYIGKHHVQKYHTENYKKQRLNQMIKENQGRQRLETIDAQLDDSGVYMELIIPPTAIDIWPFRLNKILDNWGSIHFLYSHSYCEEWREYILSLPDIRSQITIDGKIKAMKDRIVILESEARLCKNKNDMKDIYKRIMDIKVKIKLL